MQGGGPVDSVAIPVPVQLEGTDEEEDDEGEAEEEEDGEPGDGGEALEGEEGESHPPVEVAEIEGVAGGGANHEEAGGGAQIQHLVPGEDVERLSSSSPSSLFRLVTAQRRYEIINSPRDFSHTNVCYRGCDSIL